MAIQEAFQNYIQGISSKFQHTETSEIGYRTDFELLMKEVFAEIKVSRIDHDAKAFGGNKPDYVVYKEVPILYIETKDIGVSLDKIEKSDQMTRYFGYANLVLTDYVEFRFYREDVRKVLELFFEQCHNIENIFHDGTIEERRRIIGLICENLTLTDKVLGCDFRSPFNTMVKVASGGNNDLMGG